MKILILSDAWAPQTNGVVRTLRETARTLERQGHEVTITGPDRARFFSLTAPFYPEITLEFFAHRRLTRLLHTLNPDFIHIATEGPLGWTMRRVCLKQNRPFTTAYHTRFPEYLAARAPHGTKRLTRFLSFAALRHFHAPSTAVMVATASLEKELKTHKFKNLVLWSRGVDMEMFRPYGKAISLYEKLPRPILLYVGRLAVEKNIRAFLDLETNGSKIVIGDGPDRAMLQRDYPAAHFLGKLEGEALGRHYAASDLFVFPSTTDTFGLVLLEACATGLRVAAYPAPGPRDIFTGNEYLSFAVIDQNLQHAVDNALALPDMPDRPRAFAGHFSWQACTQQFLGHLQARPCEKDIEKAI